MYNALFKRKGGILLDLACGNKKNLGFIGIDKRKLPGVDIVWDLEKFPWPIPDGICLSIVGSHIVEHIKPWIMLDFMDEIWRITKPGGKLAFVHPYALNEYYVQDPTHCNPCSEKTWQYFDPRYGLFKVYTPKPWFIEKGFPVWQSSGVMEVIFRKPIEGETYDKYYKD